MASVFRTNLEPASGPAAGGSTDFSAAAAEAGLLLLELLPLAVLLLRRDARLLYANGVARAVLVDGLQLDPQRRCSTRRAATTMLLRGRIAEAVKSGRRCDFALPREDGPAWAACVIPMPPSSAAAADTALLVLSAGDRPCAVAAGLLVQLFGLTAAEARIALALGNGARLEDIAADNRLALNTVRCYVKQIFAKTGVRRQAQLVRLVVGGPGALPCHAGQP